MADDDEDDSRNLPLSELTVHDDAAEEEELSTDVLHLQEQMASLTELQKRSSFREATGEETHEGWAYHNERPIEPPAASLSDEARLREYSNRFEDQKRLIEALRAQILERDATIAALAEAAAAAEEEAKEKTKMTAASGDGDEGSVSRPAKKNRKIGTSSKASFVLPSTTATPMQKEEGEKLWMMTQEKIQEQQTRLNVTVAVRVRPFTQREIALQTVKCVEMHANDEDNQQCWIVDPKKTSAGPSTFRFDYCFDSFDIGATKFASQEMVFYSLGIDLLAKAWSGYHSCLFAYGQTGSGKTFSMMGSGGTYGILPRLCEALFYFIERTGTADYAVSANYIEIYNEEIKDLLHPPPTTEVEIPILKPRERIKLEQKLKKLRKAGKDEEADGIRAQLDPEFAAKTQRRVLPKIREDPEKGVIVENVKIFGVSSYADCEALLHEGTSNRTMGSTAMNANSSRSHCLFTLELQQLSKNATSKLTLVDLAGSEKTGMAQTEGQALVEGNNINLSLSTLGQCIAGLARAAALKEKMSPEQKEREAKDAEELRLKNLMKGSESSSSLTSQKKKGGFAARITKYGIKIGAPPKRIAKPEDFVPFRDSVLTWLLRDSLSGNSKTVYVHFFLLRLHCFNGSAMRIFLFSPHGNLHCS